jgi:NAD(P)-dependent dehydrogenase (short-subunit alcohol dehydrogenase family)
MSNQKIILITGAASGIGLGAAKHFLAAGAKVIASDINEKALNEQAALLGDNYQPLLLNVTIEADIMAARDTIAEQYGVLDSLINNAAAATLHEPEHLTSELFDVEMSLNLKGPMLLVKHLSDLLHKSADGSVVNICSVAAIREVPGHYLYSAAKVALDKFSRDCARAIPGIRFNSILPGVIDTPILASYGEHKEQVKAEAVKATPVGRLGTVEDIANAISFLCSDQSSFINGASLIVDGGIAAANNSPLSI